MRPKRASSILVSALAAAVLIVNCSNDDYARPDDREILSVCRDFRFAEHPTLSDAMDECWSCCAYSTDPSKELAGYNVTQHNDCLCTHVRKDRQPEIGNNR